MLNKLRKDERQKYKDKKTSRILDNYLDDEFLDIVNWKNYIQERKFLINGIKLEEEMIIKSK